MYVTVNIPCQKLCNIPLGAIGPSEGFCIQLNVCSHRAIGNILYALVSCFSVSRAKSVEPNILGIIYVVIRLISIASTREIVTNVQGSVLPPIHHQIHLDHVRLQLTMLFSLLSPLCMPLRERSLLLGKVAKNNYE